MQDFDARAIDLELRFMKLERELAELSAVVATQQRTIDALRADALRRRDGERDPRDPRGESPDPSGAEASGPSREDRLRDDRPPHY